MSRERWAQIQVSPAAFRICLQLPVKPCSKDKTAAGRLLCWQTGLPLQANVLDRRVQGLCEMTLGDNWPSALDQ